MTRYETIRQNVQKYTETGRKYISECEVFAHAIYTGLRPYLEIPESYPSLDGTQLPYLSLFKIVNFEKNQQVSNIREAITYHGDESFDFSIGVVLEEQADRYPKYRLQLTIVCSHKGNQFDVGIGGDTVTCGFDGAKLSGIEKVHDLIVRKILEWLEFPKPKKKIGFIADRIDR